MLFFNEKDKKQTLYNEVFRKKDADKFIIITGYTGPQMINDLANLEYDEIILVVGMYGKKINPNLHKSILNSNNTIKNLKVYYTNKLVHTKLYAWYKNNKIEDFLIGSANFSTNALLENAYRETLYRIDSKLEEKNIIEYINSIFNDMYICTELDLKPVHIKKDYPYGWVADEVETYKVSYSKQLCKLSLLASASGKGDNILGIKNDKGEVHAAAGLNWGYTSGLPLLGDAYIPITRKNIEETPDLLPIKPKGENKPIEVIWDDGETMLLLLEGNGAQASDGNFYPKQVSTYRNKSELGNYIRRRIGEKIGKNLIYSEESIYKLKKIKKQFSGDKESIVNNIKSDPDLYKELREKFITLDYLKQYGRTDITVKLLTEGVYSFDFSV